jgi:60 kDa SS-A/Ro ribonucleoprotein
MLTALPLTDQHWKQIAGNATWNQIRMNLNAFERHGVFKDQSMVDLVAQKLQDTQQIKRSKAFPYQLFTAFLNIEGSVPRKISVALQKAAETALENIPEFSGKVYVMVDTSGSMGSAVTGNRGTATTKMRVIDVAALFASAIMKKCPDAEIIPFDTSVHSHKLNPLDSIMTNAKTLAAFGGGGTNCSVALESLNKRNAKGDLVIYLSDNESWCDSSRYRSTATMTEWNKFKSRNPSAKMVCIDVTPNGTTQASGKDVLNIGGFSDSVFDMIYNFMEYGNDAELWVKTIEQVKL